MRALAHVLFPALLAAGCGLEDAPVEVAPAMPEAFASAEDNEDAAGAGFAEPDSGRMAELLARAKNPEDEDRRAAVRGLADLGPAAIPYLVEIAEGEDDAVAGTAVATLRRFGRAAVPALLRTLQTGSDEVRNWSATVLQFAGDATAVPGLLRAWDSGSARTKASCRRALEQLGDEAVPGLTAALPSASAEAQLALMGLLAECGPAAHEAAPVVAGLLESENAQAREAAREALVSIGPDSIPDILETLRTNAGANREAAVDVLRTIADFHDPEIVREELVVAELARAVRETDGPIAFHCMRLLCGIGTRADDVLASLLADPDRDLRRSTLEGLRGSRWGRDSLAPSLIALLNDADAVVVDGAAECLASCGPEVLRSVANRLHSWEEGDRMMAVRVLGHCRYRSDSGLRELHDSLRFDPSPRVRAEAAGALGAREHRSVEHPDLGPLEEAFRSDPSAHVRCAAATAIGTFGASAKGVGRTLLEGLREESVALAAAGALAEIGFEPARVLPVLITWLDPRDPDRCAAAIGAVGRYQERAAAAVPALLACVESPGPGGSRIRDDAIFALGEIGEQAKPAMPCLEKWRNAPDLSFRARYALWKLGRPRR